VQNLGPPAFGIGNHGAEFDAAEDPALFADPIRAIENRPGRIEHDATEITAISGDRTKSATDDSSTSRMRLRNSPDHRGFPAMQRNGGKLPDVLDWAIPGQAVVKLGHHPDIDTRLPRLGYDRVTTLASQGAERKISSAKNLRASCSN
jgi:hypothetical protein